MGMKYWEFFLAIIDPDEPFFAQLNTLLKSKLIKMIIQPCFLNNNKIKIIKVQKWFQQKLG